ncbi:MAG: DNA-binding protein [Panacagrimonas sp.]
MATFVESLNAEGLEPTLERVRANLGSFSYTTINRARPKSYRSRQAGNTEAADIPADLVEIARATWTIHIIGRLLDLY